VGLEQRNLGFCICFKLEDNEFVFDLNFRIYLLYRPWAIRKSKVLTWPTRPATAAVASSSRLFRLPWLYAAVWFRQLERQS